MLLHACDPSIGRCFSEFEASLDYRGSSKPARLTRRKQVFKNQIQKERKRKEGREGRGEGGKYKNNRSTYLEMKQEIFGRNYITPCPFYANPYFRYLFFIVLKISGHGTGEMVSW